jgi:hypothetical protein
MAFDPSNIVFGRVPSQPDVRDLRYPMRAYLPPEITVVSRFWPTGPILDQGSTPMCVGYAGRQFLTSEPVQTIDGPTAPELYAEAQANDEWDGTAYDGTSVRGLANALTKEGRLTSYVWAASALDVRDYLITTGTVIAGTDWKRNMFTPSKNGLLKVSGPVAGGHAYLLSGYDAVRNWFEVTNSWSESWGLGGKAYIAFDDFDRLLKANGEGLAAMEQALVPVVITVEAVAAMVQDVARRVAVLEAKQTLA